MDMGASLLRFGCDDRRSDGRAVRPPGDTRLVAVSGGPDSRSAPRSDDRVPRPPSCPAATPGAHEWCQSAAPGRCAREAAANERIGCPRRCPGRCPDGGPRPRRRERIPTKPGRSYKTGSAWREGEDGCGVEEKARMSEGRSSANVIALDRGRRLRRRPWPVGRADPTPSAPGRIHLGQRGPVDRVARRARGHGTLGERTGFVQPPPLAGATRPRGCSWRRSSPGNRGAPGGSTPRRAPSARSRPRRCPG